MAPKLPQTVTITTPQDPVVDPATGLETIPPPHVAPGVAARLSQKPIADLGSQIELLATQDTTISLWSLLVGPREVLTSRSTVVHDASGRRFEVVGQPADRPDHKPQFRAAALRLISDMQ